MPNILNDNINCTIVPIFSGAYFSNYFTSSFYVLHSHISIHDIWDSFPRESFQLLIKERSQNIYEEIKSNIKRDVCQICKIYSFTCLFVQRFSVTIWIIFIPGKNNSQPTTKLSKINVNLLIYCPNWWTCQIDLLFYLN